MCCVSGTVCRRLGLEPVCWALNPAITHTACSQCLMKLREYSERVISKRWTHWDSERNTLHIQSVGHGREQVLQNVAWLVFIGWVISYPKR